MQTQKPEIFSPSEKIKIPGNQIAENNKQSGSSGCLFEPFWSPQNIIDGLNRGTLIKGKLRISPKNFEHCYVSHPITDTDIFICGLMSRNRALNDDEVAVKLEPRANWRIEMDWFNENCINCDLMNSKNSCKSRENSYLSISQFQTIYSKEYKMFFSNVEDLNSTSDFDSKIIPNWMEMVQRTGKVVTILRAIHSRQATGILTVPNKKKSLGDKEADQTRSVDALKDSEIPTGSSLKANQSVGIKKTLKSESQQPMQRFQYGIFKPHDSRFPRLRINRDCMPREFVERPQDFRNSVFIARLTIWGDNSPYALGEIVENLDSHSYREREIRKILLSSNVLHSGDSFSAGVEAELPHLFQLAQHDCAQRLDLRHTCCVFTIDPPTARDLDDALHVRLLPPTQDSGGPQLEVGVHIADVSHYVRPSTQLDQAAAERATTVYLVDRVIPMLPRALCEHLCSLTPGEDKLAFSVLFRMDAESGRLVSTRFCRTVIRSCAQLSYGEAQMCIDHPREDFLTVDPHLVGKQVDTAPPPPELRLAVSKPFTANQVRDSVNQMWRLATVLKQARQAQGTLRIDKPHVCFRLDGDSGIPVDYRPYQLTEANSLIEEWMLLANMSVAATLFKYLPNVALLRKHDPPDSKLLTRALRQADLMGFQIKADSAGELQSSLSNAVSQCTAEEAKLKAAFLSEMFSRCMQLARYVCAGVETQSRGGTSAGADLLRHYSLNTALYTHFTSPIRRYPDILVHRQLTQLLPLLDGSTEPSDQSTAALEAVYSLSGLALLADHCNQAKKAAKEASEACDKLFFSLLLLEQGAREMDCLVMKVLDHSIDAVIVETSIALKIYVEHDFHLWTTVDFRGRRRDCCREQLLLEVNQEQQEQQQQLGLVSIELRVCECCAPREVRLGGLVKCQISVKSQTQDVPDKLQIHGSIIVPGCELKEQN